LQPGARSLVIGVSTDIEAAIKGLTPDGCVLLGKTPYDEVTRLLGNAKVGLDVHPWLAPHLEVALPVKVCEYMAAGCAVVASSMPVLKQILARTGAEEDAITLIEAGKPVDYARAVAHLVKVIEQGADPGAQLCELARKHLIWEEEAANIARLYQELLQKPCAI
jgi:glycosyltransferase involved in cell wall biosynthesis